MKKLLLSFALVSLMGLSGCSKASGGEKEKDKDICPKCTCKCEIAFGKPHTEEGMMCHGGEVVVGYEEDKAVCSKLSINHEGCCAAK